MQNHVIIILILASTCFNFILISATYLVMRKRTESLLELSGSFADFVKVHSEWAKTVQVLLENQDTINAYTSKNIRELNENNV